MDSGTAPHLPVRLLMRGGACRQLVHKLCAPKVSACLPSGTCPPPLLPLLVPAGISVEALDDAYSPWISAVEQEALTFSAPGREEADAMCGRGSGHSVVWRNALGPPGSQFLKQSFGARRWRLLADWLMQLVRALAAGALAAPRPRGDGARWTGAHVSWAHVSWAAHAKLILRARFWRDLNDDKR